MARRRNPLLPLLTLALFAAVAGVAAFAVLRADGDPSEPGGAASDVTVPPPVGAPSGSTDPGELTAVAGDRIEVVASSALADDGDLTYGAENTLDADLDTAWNSDSSTYGRGETLSFRFAEPIDLRAIRFVNGYAKNESVFDKNHRVKTILLHTDGGSREVTLLDTAERQEVSAAFGPTAEVVVEVTDVYVGSGFDGEFTADLALTEIEFLVGPG